MEAVRAARVAEDQPRAWGRRPGVMRASPRPRPHLSRTVTIITSLPPAPLMTHYREQSTQRVTKMSHDSTNLSLNMNFNFDRDKNLLKCLNHRIKDMHIFVGTLSYVFPF